MLGTIGKEVGTNALGHSRLHTPPSLSNHHPITHPYLHQQHRHQQESLKAGLVIREVPKI